MIYNYILVNNYIIPDSPLGMTIARPYNFLETTIDNLFWASRVNDIPKYEILAAGIFKFFFAFMILANLFRSELKIDFTKNRKSIYYFFYIFSVILLLFLLFPQSIRYVPLFEKHIITDSVIGLIIMLYLIFHQKRKIRLLLLTLFIISLLNFDIRIIGDDSKWDTYFQTKGMAQYINQYYQAGDLVIDFSYYATDTNYFLKPEISAVAFSPLLASDNDWYYSRLTLGFVENQAQFRMRNMKPEEERIKINYLLKKYQPNRIWLIGFPDESITRNWLSSRDWRHAVKPVGDLFQVDLFVKGGYKY